MRSFDYIVIGGGYGGLAIGALLAKSGKSVLLLEKEKTLGGWARTEKLGEYQFVPGAQCLNGLYPGGPMWKFLGLVGLSDMKFNTLNPSGYDIALTSGLKFEIPSGLDEFREKLAEKFPAEKDNIRDYFKLVDAISKEVNIDGGILTWEKILRSPFKHKTILSTMRKTPAEIFRKFNFSKELTFILYSQGGDLGLSSQTASFPLLAGLHSLYGQSAGFPGKGIGHLIDSLTSIIKQSPTSEIITDACVTEIETTGRHVSVVHTNKGAFKANTSYISNLDPQLTYRLAGEKPKQKAYSDAPFILNLCFDNYDIKKHGFGNFNYWIHETMDPDDGFFNVKQRMTSKLERVPRAKDIAPWVFLSTPSFLADPGTVAPLSSSSMTLLTFVPYGDLNKLKATSNELYNEYSLEMKEYFYNILHRKFALSRSKITGEIWNDPFFYSKLSPEGNVYGPALSVGNYSFAKQSQKSKFKNLFFNGASSSFPGIMPISVGSMDLFKLLTEK